MSIGCFKRLELLLEKQKMIVITVMLPDKVSKIYIK